MMDLLLANQMIHSAFFIMFTLILTIRCSGSAYCGWKHTRGVCGADMCVCVCVCVRARARVCVCAHV
jgi:hypothetical protein